MALAMVKNEADIIEASIRHNLAFVDLMVVIDNASTDGTREILEALRAEGLPLVILDDPVFGHFQGEKVTHAYRMTAPVFTPDLVYLLDADEFLRAPSRESLQQALGRLAPGSAALLPWETHVPDAGVPMESFLADPMGYSGRRRRQEEPLYYKAVIRRDPADDARLVIEQGNHAVRRADGVPVPHQPVAQGAAVAHLPVRGVEQLTAKVVNGWQACQVRNRVKNVPGEAYQWQQLHDRIVAGRPLTDGDLVATAMAYAQRPRADRDPVRDLVADPVPTRHGPLRHLALGRHSALAKLAGSLAGAMATPAALPPGIVTARALDLPPVLDLCRGAAVHRAVVMAGDTAWTDALAALRPEIELHVPREDVPDPDIDLVLAPALPAALATDLGSLLDPRKVRRVVYWPEHRRAAGDLEAELLAWQRAGWEPDMMRTMTFRALSNFRGIRGGALVLGPADPSAAARAAAVSAALCTIDAQPLSWQDPPLPCVMHPLQPLALEVDPPSSAKAGPADAASAPAVPPAAAPVAQPGPRSVLICGSGRSGTSCLAGMFGPDTHRHADDLYAPSPSNPKGFFECRQVNDLNEAILVQSALANAGEAGARALLQGYGPGQLWLARFPDAMPASWTDAQRRDIARTAPAAPFCLKDPRFSLTAPAWLEQAPDAAVLSIHRAPAITAESVLAECRRSPYLRDFRISVADAFAVWRQMYRRVLKLFLAGADVVFLRYEDLFDDARLARLEALVRAPLRRQFAERQFDRSQPGLAPDSECEALHAVLEELARDTFTATRAMQCERIQAFFAAWPDRTSTAQATTAPAAIPAPAPRIAQADPSFTGDAGRRTAERLARIRGDAVGTP
jgi:hypothetical protein